MCGIFGIFSNNQVDLSYFRRLAKHNRRRGSDAYGILISDANTCIIERSDGAFLNSPHLGGIRAPTSAIGHCRMITQGDGDHHPLYADGVSVIHNGIILNDDKVWRELDDKPSTHVDTEIILKLACVGRLQKTPYPQIAQNIISTLKGSISCCILFHNENKAILLSNTGSLYFSTCNQSFVFSSEKHQLKNLPNVEQLKNKYKIIDIVISHKIEERNHRVIGTLPIAPNISKIDRKVFEFAAQDLKRCTNCILPETMPYIKFNDRGVCNYCENYSKIKLKGDKKDFEKIIEKYKSKFGNKCIVPFSGGRDSSWSLDILCKEYGMEPITYTYDWGMVTDIARRNISLMCAELGLENILVSADIRQKRKNIAKNLAAWLRTPKLGMLSVLTAGDKHFFKYINTVRRETGISFNVWGINPLETTHFKSGFLGIPPDFYNSAVYKHGILSQYEYQKRRFIEYCREPKYFNASLIDTISGEFYRSVVKKHDYVHLFDFIQWDEPTCDDSLLSYGWERASDTTTTWRIGDGTAGFYNYVYYSVAGFSEHDTFRSNQIRQGQITRARALELVHLENQPRPDNIQWYLKVLGFDVEDVIRLVNKIPKLYNV